MMTSLNSLTNVSSWSSFDGMSRLLFLSVMVLRQKACRGIFSDMHKASPYSCNKAIWRGWKSLLLDINSQILKYVINNLLHTH